MIFEFKLPDIGEGLVEGEIVDWMVKEGDEVKEDQPLCELLTEKATVEIPSPVSGKIVKLLAKPGDVVPVKSVIVHIERGAGAAAAPETPEAPEADEAPAESDDPPSLFTPTKAPAKKGRAKAAPVNGGSSPVPTPAAAATVSRGRAIAAPSTRRLARELGVDLEAVPGTGPGGRVTAEDVRGFAGGGPASLSPFEAGHGGAAPSGPAIMEGTASRPVGVVLPPVGAGPRPERREPLRGLRRRIAEAMLNSKRTQPHYAYFEEVDATELVRLRESAKPLAEKKGVKLTYLPFIVKAVTAALKSFPLVNSCIDEETQEIVYKGYYDIGIATATDSGLIVPVVKRADRLDVFQLAAEISRVAKAARGGRGSVSDLKGSTFTITNFGSVGGWTAAPILNSPEAGIMGVGSTRKKPWVVDGNIVVRDIMVISFSFDHRLVDGAVGAQFAQVIKKYLETPGLLGL